MKKILVAGREADSEAILEFLVAEGTVQINPLESADDVPQADGETARRLATDRSRLSTAIREIERRFGLKKQMFSIREPIEEDVFLALKQEPQDVLERLFAFEQLLEQDGQLRQRDEKLAVQQEQLLPWLSIPIELSVTETEKTAILYGIANDPVLLEDASTALQEETDGTALIPLSRDGKKTLLAVIARKHDISRVRSRLAGADFQPLPLTGVNGTPKAVYERLTVERQSIEKELAENLGKQEAFTADRDNFAKLCDALGEREAEVDAALRLGRTDRTVYFTGWIPARAAERTKRRLMKKIPVAVELSDPAPDEAFPILLENNKFNRAFEVILTLFGAPSHDELDPMPVMAPFYMITFGMMLSDVGYGLLLTLVAAFLLYKVKVEGNMKNMTQMLFLSGIASTAWGFVFGGFFGDLIPTLTQERYVFPVLWFDPLESPMTLLLFSMFFGVIHLFAGMALKIANEKRNGRLLDGILEVVPWYMIIVGLIVYLGSSAGAFGQASGFLAPIAMWLTIAGAVTIIINTIRLTKKPFSGFFKGLLALYDITGYLSDILSYARILALVLATSVIAVVFNNLAGIALPSIPGYIIFVILAVPMHILNLALSALSAYVHASRLQYVEMFGKFFDGGGQYFKPLCRDTKHVRVLAGPDDPHEQ
jgi:V/A-type H+-transporting ATPase subunit I